MQGSFRANRKKFQNRFISISSIFIIVLVGVIVIAFSRLSISENVEKRVFEELKGSSSMQVASLTRYMDEQYLPLETLAELLQNGEQFASESMRPTLKALMQTSQLCMVGFADLNGDVTNYEGEPFGNISDRSYFYDIVNGTASKKCEYLAVTKAINEPRVLFSIPAYDENGKMLGVLFCSREIAVLEDTLFGENELFAESSYVFVCDTDGNVIVANENADALLADAASQKPQRVCERVPNLGEMYQAGAESGQTCIDGVDYYVSLVPLGINHWYLGHLVAQQTATELYASSLESVRRLAAISIVAFFLAFAYIVMISGLLFRQKQKDIQSVASQYENYKTLLKEMNCTVIEYSLKGESIKLISDDEDRYGIRDWGGSWEAYEANIKQHPEFDLSELKREAILVRKSNQTHAFETLFAKDHAETFWIRIILVPIIQEEQTIGIFGLALDITDLHKNFDNVIETFKKIPGGVHRCYLSDPIHLEYYNESLCKMLGYTNKEVRAIIGPDWDYAQLIYEDDRQTFETFVQELAASGGRQTCEYRMICKDGSKLEVTDTMDATLSSSGIMYGYSVVTDLRKYKQAQQELEHQLEVTQEHLELARIKNSSSQMQPHFLYNALGSIREIILEDPQYASDLVYDFTTHLRACIRSMSSDSLVPFSQELNNIKAYVNIERMRFGEKLDVCYACDEMEFDIIPLSIQPLVENAIRHGIYERGAAGGHVMVRTSRVHDNILVQVEDDGVGFDYEAVMKEVEAGTRDSTGLMNLTIRLKKLQNAQISVDSKIGVGTTITVTIPRGERK